MCRDQYHRSRSWLGDELLVFGPAVERAGIEDFHWHDLLHTFASRLVMAGVDLTTVKELMGHKTIVMIQRYVHLSPGHKLDAMQRLTRPTNRHHYRHQLDVRGGASRAHHSSP